MRASCGRVVQFFYCLILASVARSGWGQTLLTLNDAVNEATGKSPDIRALENQLDAAEARAHLTLSPTEPTFQINYADMTAFMRRDQASSTVYTVTQPIAFPGKAFLNHSVANSTSRALEYQLKAKRTEVLGNIRAAYLGLAVARKNLDLNQDQQDSYRNILSIAKRRYESGAITQVDFLNAEVSLLSSENDRRDLESTERTALTQLNALLNDPPETPRQIQMDEALKFTPRPLPTLEEARQKMLTGRYEIQAANAQSHSAARSAQLAWMSLLPDFQLQFGSTYYNLVTASPVNPQAKTYFVGLQMTMPIWFLFNERESIVAAHHDRAAADANREIVYHQSEVALENAWTSLRSINAKLATYQNELLPLAEQSFRLALTGYSSGRIDFQSLADTATARRSIRRDYYNFIVTRDAAYTTLAQLMGETLR